MHKCALRCIHAPIALKGKKRGEPHRHTHSHPTLRPTYGVSVHSITLSPPRQHTVEPADVSCRCHGGRKAKHAPPSKAPYPYTIPFQLFAAEIEDGRATAHDTAGGFLRLWGERALHNRRRSWAIESLDFRRGPPQKSRYRYSLTTPQTPNPNVRDLSKKTRAVK